MHYGQKILRVQIYADCKQVQNIQIRFNPWEACRRETGKKRTGIRKKLYPNGKTIESGLSVKKYLFNFAAAWLTGCQSNNL